MHSNLKFYILVFVFCVSFACKEEIHYGKEMPSYCEPTQIIASSNKCVCNISFSNYLYYTDDYTYISIESSYYEIGPPCNQNVFKIKYINSIHDHNEADYEFSFHMPRLSIEQFFAIDTFAIDTIGIYESKPTGGHGSAKYDVDVTLIWDSVSISEGVYWGSGKFIFNDSIPSIFPNYFWPKQEINFEFCKE